MKEPLLSGVIAGACLLGMPPCFAAAPAASDADALDTDALIARLHDDALSEAAVDAIVRDLAATEAVDDIHRAALSREFDAFRTGKLARALAMMGTDEALAALRGMLFTSVFVSGDVGDWRALAGRITRGEAETAGALKRAVWAALSDYVRGVLKDAAATGEVDGARVRDVVRALNSVLKDRGLFRHLEGSGVRLRGEGPELLARHAAHPEPKPGTALSRIEVERLNRLILDCAFEGAVSPLGKQLGAPPIAGFHPHAVRAAHEALGVMKTAAAKELLLNAEPIGFADRLRQVKIVGDMPGRDADAALALYLTDDETAISARARDALIARFAKRPTAVALAMREVLARVASTSGARPEDSALADVFAVCVGAPREEDAARLLARGVAAESERVVLAALEALARRPALVGDPSLLKALARAVERTRSGTLRKKALAVIAKARAPGGADVAAMCLDDPDLEVQTLAVKALRRTTDLKLGMSPKAWRDHFAAEPTAASPEAPPPAAVVREAKLSPLALATLVGLPVLATVALAGVALRRRMFRARIDAEIARRGRGRA
ncbi:MAG: hypothetical protein ACYS9X_04860 [Planctomycetota bacterium]|jgi:hypothetical protein